MAVSPQQVVGEMKFSYVYHYCGSWWSRVKSEGWGILGYDVTAACASALRHNMVSATASNLVSETDSQLANIHQNHQSSLTGVFILPCEMQHTYT